MKMTKKTIFLVLLFPMVFGTVNGRAQVRIGGDAAPHQSAVLDLNETNAADAGNLGLALPRVSLTGNDALLSGATAATGTVVYNTNTAVTDGLDGKGLYVWDGQITPDGEVTGTYNGMITVRATTPNGVFAEKRLVVRNPLEAEYQQIGDNEYPTFTYNGIVWMVQNLRETPKSGSYLTYGGEPNPDVDLTGLYYNKDALPGLCPSPWRIPSPDETNALGTYLQHSGTATPFEVSLWFDMAHYAGFYRPSDGTWAKR
ncbi:MAG: fibrobacter succinogenes major paralogous domain-containing protein [Dysgonamonadaceae bacterium]|jgi:hypothetical protein|nr:fibrobacter succinogenes major paralogous domain-containing protein [Dysgonamonadaceae bacterium]